MMRAAGRTALLALALGWSAAGAPPAAAACADAPLAGATLCLVNAERQAAGLRPLRADARLAEAAGVQASDMVAHHYFAHVGPSGATMVDRVRGTGWLCGRRRWALGETLAWGTGPLGTPAAIVAAWMASPGHHAILMRPRYRRVGIDVVDGTPFTAGVAGATFAADFGAGPWEQRRARRRHCRRGA